MKSPPPSPPYIPFYAINRCTRVPSFPFLLPFTFAITRVRKKKRAKSIDIVGGLARWILIAGLPWC